MELTQFFWIFGAVSFRINSMSLFSTFIPKYRCGPNRCTFVNSNGALILHCSGLKLNELDRTVFGENRRMFLTKHAVSLTLQHVPDRVIPKKWYKAKHNINSLQISQSDIETIEAAAFQTDAFKYLKCMELMELPLIYIDNGIFNGLNYLKVLVLRHLAIVKIDFGISNIHSGWISGNNIVNVQQMILGQPNRSVKVEIDQNNEIIRNPLIKMRTLPIMLLTWLMSSCLAIISGGVSSMIVKHILTNLLEYSRRVFYTNSRIHSRGNLVREQSATGFIVAKLIMWRDQFNR